MKTEDFAGVMVKYFSKDDLNNLEGVNDEWKGAVKSELQKRKRIEDKEYIEDLVEREYCYACDDARSYDRIPRWENKKFLLPTKDDRPSQHHYPFLSIDYTNKDNESLPGKFFPNCCYSGNKEKNIPEGVYSGDC